MLFLLDMISCGNLKYNENTVQPETQRLILQRITSIEKELKALKELVHSSEVSEQVFEEYDIIDAEIIESEHISAEGLLENLFLIMKHKQSSEEQQKEVTPLIHSSIADYSPSLDSFFRFSFKTFQDRWSEYLNDKKETSSFQVERQKENRLGELLELKLYLISTNRSPSPITFKQDPKHDMAWRIHSLSL